MTTLSLKFILLGSLGFAGAFYGGSWYGASHPNPQACLIVLGAMAPTVRAPNAQEMKQLDDMFKPERTAKPYRDR